MKKTTKAAVKTTTKTTKKAAVKKTTTKKAAVKKTTTKKAAGVSTAGRLAQSVESGRFSDIKVPDALRTTLKTGWEYIDALFTGEGIRPSTCCMVTGLPGGGKTTICLQLANSLAEQGHVVLYNSCEESGAQIKMKLEKMEFEGLLTSDNAFFSSFYDIADILAFADKIRKTVTLAPGKGFFLLVDSLQTIERTSKGAGRPAGPAQQQCDAMWDIAAWCKENMTVAMIIGQVTKDGTFAGKQEVKHAVDCHMHLAMDTDKKSETYRQRVAEMQKNRFGASGLFFPYEISSKGIEFAQ
jgi:DNA repair protein RadA/Sms